MKPFEYILMTFAACLFALLIIAFNTPPTNTKQIKYNNSIIKSNYNVKLNTFNIMYTKNCDTLALDDLYPHELDSLINTLNK